MPSATHYRRAVWPLAPQHHPLNLNVVVKRCWCRHPRWCWLRLPCVVDTCWNGAAVSGPMLLPMLTTADVAIVVVSASLLSLLSPLPLQSRRRQVSRCRATSCWDDDHVFDLFLFCWLLCSCNCYWFCRQRPLSFLLSGWLSGHLVSRRRLYPLVQEDPRGMFELFLMHITILWHVGKLPIVFGMDLNSKRR